MVSFLIMRNSADIALQTPGMARLRGLSRARRTKAIPRASSEQSSQN